MKHVLFVFAATFLINISFSQKTDGSLPNVIKDTLYTTSGYKITPKQFVTIGRGTMPDGTFKYIRINQNSFFNTNSGIQNADISKNAMPPSFSGHQFEVVRIEWRGKPKFGFTYYVILKTGVVKYEIDIENAIASGEIVVPDEFKPKTNNSFQGGQKISVADELTKLKKLYDDGVLTKDEYEAQKKKLLNSD